MKFGHTTGRKRAPKPRQTTLNRTQRMAQVLADSLKGKTSDALLAVPAWTPAPARKA